MNVTARRRRRRAGCRRSNCASKVVSEGSFGENYSSTDSTNYNHDDKKRKTNDDDICSDSHNDRKRKKRYELEECYQVANMPSAIVKVR